MYENPAFNEKGEKILCEEKGKNSHMLMDVRVISARSRSALQHL